MKQWKPWLVCVFVSFIILDLQLVIYCDAPGYKARTYDTEELVMDKKKTAFRLTYFYDSVKRLWAIRSVDVGTLLAFFFFFRWCPMFLPYFVCVFLALVHLQVCVCAYGRMDIFSRVIIIADAAISVV